MAWQGFVDWLFCLFPVVLVGKLGALHLAPAYAASATLIYLLRDWLEAESSLFSIPTRFWPPLLLAVALLAQFGK